MSIRLWFGLLVAVHEAENQAGSRNYHWNFFCCCCVRTKRQWHFLLLSILPQYEKKLDCNWKRNKIYWRNLKSTEIVKKKTTVPLHNFMDTNRLSWNFVICLSKLQKTDSKMIRNGLFCLYTLKQLNPFLIN